MFRRRPPRGAVATAPAAPDPTLCTGPECDRNAGPDGLCSVHRETQGAAAAVTAAVSSVEMDGATWQTWRFGSTAWQREAWRLYDITGQLRFVANWVGNSVSRCRLYVADVDEAGEAGMETEDPEVAALAAGPLGSGPAKDEALRLLGINMFVPGEAYVVAEADGDDGDDRWFVVSGQQIGRSGSEIRIRRSLLQGGGDMVFRPDVDLLLRVWTPHPADTDQADSPTRSAIPDLREIEALRKREFAELDSRLAGAGLLLVPEGIDFPKGDGDAPGPAGLAAVLMRAMATSLRDRASADAMVPIIAKAPPEVIDKIKHLTFWSELSDQILPLREAAIKSLAQSLDVPAEILLGMTEVNHWSGWLVSEDAVSTQIVPILSRIADALTTGYLRRALEQLGRDPDKYAYAFDTAPLTTRPNRAADALNYHATLLLSDQAAVEAGAFTADQMPDDEERKRRIVEKAVMGAPSLLSDPALQALIGITPSTSPPPPAEPAPPAGDGGGPAEVEGDRDIPERTPQTEETTAALVAVASLATLRALALAGGRLVPHRQRDRWPGTPRHQLHARHGPISRADADHALRGAWDDLALVAADLYVDPAALTDLLHGFAAELLTRGMAYDPALLRDLVAAAVRTRRLDAPVGVGA